MAFFVLSGFLVGGQVLARLRKGRFYVYDYAIDRSTRIFIPLIPACLFTAVITVFVLRQPLSVSELLANMTGLNEIIAPTLDTNAVLWSLSYEIWFYILAGGAGYVFSKRINLGAALVLGACAIVFTVLQTRYLVFWILGACASEAHNIRYKGPLALAGACLSLVGVLFYELAADSRSVTPIAYIPPLVAEFLMCIGLVAVMPFLATERANKALSPLMRVSAMLGGFSYTLSHSPPNRRHNRHVFRESQCR